MKESLSSSKDDCMWVDPLREAHAHGEVLLADQIRKYVKDHGLLIQDGYAEENLKGASYSMSANKEDGWVVENRDLVALKTGRDTQARPYYIIPSNSLVWIGLKETLRLPFYMIARHNLKIQYVYQGLLLGTGPQVDPGYHGRLYIPLHNFTNENVHVYINESFVNIDFSLTTPVALNKGQPSDLKDFYARYTHLKPIPLDKIGRKSVEDYLKGHRPTSSLRALVEQLKRQSREFRERKTLDVFAFIGAVVGAVTVFGALYVEDQRIDVLYDGLKADLVPEMLAFKESNQNLLKQQGELIDQVKSLQSKMTEQNSPKEDKTSKTKGQHQ